MNAVPVAKVMRAQGLQGALRVQIFAKEAESLAGLKKLQLQLKSGEIQEFTLNSITPASGQSFIFNLAESKDRNFSESLVGAVILVPEDHFVSEPGERIFLREMLDFAVVDLATQEHIGQIKEFSSNGPQDLLGIHFANQRIWIPFVEELVPNIDYEQKIVSLNLPEGMLELAEKL